MIIQQPTFIEETDFEYRISFLYKGKNLQTRLIQRSEEKREVKNIICDLCSEFDSRRSDENFERVKQEFNAETVEI